MPRRHRNRRRTMRGGFLDSLTSTLSGWGSSISQGASNAWNSTKKATGISSSTPSYTATPSYGNTQNLGETQNVSTSYGGRTRRRNMKGGFKDYTPQSGLAANAAPFSGPSAKPHTMVGGKSRKYRHHNRKHRHTKSCRHHKH